jgi:CheY-like chemotaxis protein
MRILIAEDVDDTRCLMRLLLEMKGHSVTEATNGKEAVERAVIDHPDLILMDVTMPVMDGLCATRNIRANPSTSLIPIVAVSALMGDPQWRGRALESGCSGCYVKPLDFEALDGMLATQH